MVPTSIRAATCALLLMVGDVPAAEPTSRITVPRLPEPRVAVPQEFSDRYRPPGKLGRDRRGRDRMRPLNPALPRVTGGCRGVIRNAQARAPDCAGKETGGTPPPRPGGEPSGCARFGETLICP